MIRIYDLLVGNLNKMADTDFFGKFESVAHMDRFFTDYKAMKPMDALDKNGLNQYSEEFFRIENSFKSMSEMGLRKLHSQFMSKHFQEEREKENALILKKVPHVQSETKSVGKSGGLSL